MKTISRAQAQRFELEYQDARYCAMLDALNTVWAPHVLPAFGPDRTLTVDELADRLDLPVATLRERLDAITEPTVDRYDIKTQVRISCGR